MRGPGTPLASRLAAYGANVFSPHHSAHDRDQPWGADDTDAVLGGVRFPHLVGEARVAGMSADLSESQGAVDVVDAAVAEFGRLDGLVCNQALSGADGALGDLTADDLDRHWAVDARASLLLAQAFLRHHRAGDPAAVAFLTSGQSQGPMPGEVAYAAAKAALAGVTLTLADQLAGRGIRVNTVNPGPVNTGYLTPEAWETVSEKFPSGRFGEPDDPARLLAWLLTDEARWITGQVIHSEGGFARWR